MQEQEFQKLLARFSGDERDVLEQAYAFAKEHHAGQSRDEGTDYIIHPLRSALTLVNEFGVQDADMIVSMLLHDIVEDTDVTCEDVQRRFGETVEKYVCDLTRERAAEETEEEKLISKPIKFTWFMKVAPRESKVLKCADLLDNLRSWWFIPEGHPSEQKFERWFREAKTYSLPLAEEADPAILTLFQQEFTRFQQEPRFAHYI